MSGLATDIQTLDERFRCKTKMYELNENRKMKPTTFANVVASTLYEKRFGPYFVEQYILMEVLSKAEVAQNVLDYYALQKEKLQRGLASYSEAQGKGFVCWRFINEYRRPDGAPPTPRGERVGRN